MKTSGSLLIILTMLLACVNRSDGLKGEVPVQVRVAAYNVEYSTHATAREIGESLKAFDFDVVAFSEAPGGKWTEEVAEVLGMDHVIVGRYSTAGHLDKYKTIASRTELYDYEEILMADTLHTVTMARTRIDDIEIVLYSVHFPFGWRDQEHIDETTGKISSFVNYLRERQGNEISFVMGDFNFIPSNSEFTNMYHEMFRDIGLEVSWQDLGADTRKLNTYNALNHEDEGNGNLIDHIMYNTDKAFSIEGGIIEMEQPLSDHKPVWALVELK